MPPRAVFDTNVFVAAGFNPASHAARLVGAVREGELTLVWNADTRAEVLNTLSRIPPLAGLDVAALFRPEAEFRAAAAPTGYGAIPDPADRVFAALADAAGVPLVTNDAHLLDHRAAMRVPVLTPRAFWDATMAARGTGTSGGEEAGPDTLRRLRSSPLWLLAAPATLWLCGAVYLPIAAPALVGTARWLVALILAVLTVLSFVAHALAHAAVARRLGAPLPDRIPLGLLGDVAQAWAPAAVPRHEALIALAGPGASAALAGLGGLLWSAQLGPAPDAAALFVAILNGALAALNLAPGFPLDGGRLVQLALQGVVRRPERVSAALGAALACALLAWGGAVAAAGSRFSGETGAALGGLAVLVLLALARHRPRRARTCPLQDRPARLRRGAAAVLLTGTLLVPPLALTPTPAGLYAPGGVVPVAPMIEVAGVEPPDTGGELLLTTVVGQTPILAAQWAAGQLDPAVAIVPPERVVPEHISPQELMAENARLLAESQAVATVVALRMAGYEASITGSGVQVLRVLPESPSRGLLRPGDRIVALNAVAVRTAPDLLVALSEHDAAAPATVTLARDGQRVELRLPLLPPAEPGGPPRIGITVATADLAADTPIPVRITPRSIAGGPSAGLMFTLAIYDRLTPGDLTRGWRVAGTGTVARDGRVGPIGGVAQKVAAAERAGADYFLVPQENAVDARWAARRITILAVTHVADAIEHLQRLPVRAGDARRSGAGPRGADGH